MTSAGKTIQALATCSAGACTIIGHNIDFLLARGWLANRTGHIITAVRACPAPTLSLWRCRRWQMSDIELLVAESRWNRKRKLLPRLRLRYPSDSELWQISELAKVDDLSGFGGHIRSIILDAHLNDASLRKLSTPILRKTLSSLASQADRLGKTLRAIDVESRGSAYRAGQLFELELAKLQINEGMVLLPECIDLIDVLSEAARRAALLPTAKRGPKGAGGNPAFDLFVQSLLMAARQRRGYWTNYRSAGGAWKGSLLSALEILRPYLPHRFFPSGELGRSIDHIRKKFKHYITKNLAVLG
jgi:hypothetical protein